MMLKMLGLLVLIGMGAAAAWAQPASATLMQLEPLTVTGDSNGEPVPEGTDVIIRWDWDDNGPDDKDPLPVVGDKFGQVSMNHFTFNASTFGMKPGTYFCLDTFNTVGNLTDPPTYYLEVCLKDHMLRSNVFRLSPGPQEIKNLKWTVVKEPCPEIK